jgi:hypothetical protein
LRIYCDIDNWIIGASSSFYLEICVETTNLRVSSARPIERQSVVGAAAIATINDAMPMIKSNYQSSIIVHQ